MKEISILKGGGKPNELKEAVRTMRDAMPDYIEYLKIDAQMRREKFNALIAQGFTVDQAIELCKGPL